MKLWMLNPFIRNALRFMYKPRGFPIFIRDCHLIYVERGNLSVRMENFDCELCAGSMIYLPVGSVYELYQQSPGEYPLLMVVNFDLTQAENNYTQIFYPLQYHEETKLRLFSDYPEYIQIAGKDSFLSDVAIFPSVADAALLRKIIWEFEREDGLGNDIASSVLKEFLINLHRTSLSEQKATPIVDAILRELSEHIGSPIDNSMLAARWGYHVNSLERLFRQHTGMGIHQMHLALRVKEARRLLTETMLTLSEIADRTGFVNYSYFSYYFKKQTGMSPSEYRKRRQQCE